MEVPEDRVFKMMVQFMEEQVREQVKLAVEANQGQVQMERVEVRQPSRSKIRAEAWRLLRARDGTKQPRAANKSSGNAKETRKKKQKRGQGHKRRRMRHRNWARVVAVMSNNMIMATRRETIAQAGRVQRWCMASGDSPYASSGCPWSINTGDEMGSNGFRGSSSTEGEGDHQGTTESPSGGNAVVRGETGAQGVTPTTIAELRDNGMHGIVHYIVNTFSVVADPHTTESPSGGNAVVRGEAGAPMTMAELRDGATHDVEAEEEKKKIAGAHQKIVHAHVTQDSLTTVEPGLTTVKEVRAGETNADSAAVNERPSAEVGCGRLHQTFAAYTAAPKRRGCKATLQLATTPKQELKKAKKPAQVDTPWGMRLTCDEQAMAYDSAYEEVLEMGENADKQMRAWMEDMGHAETIMNDHDSRMYAHQRAEEAVKAAMREKKATAEANDPRMAQLKMCENGDSDETKRVRSDKGTRAVQELHGQHPSLSD